MTKQARMDLQFADREGAVVLEEDDFRFFPVDARAVDRAAGGVDRDAVLARDLVGAMHVIRMLVREDDCREVFDVPAEGFEPFFRLARPDAGVDEDCRTVALEPVGIPCTTGGERGNDHDEEMVAGPGGAGIEN
jgi:hypothetical protein